MATDLSALVAKFTVKIEATCGTLVDLATRESVLRMAKALEFAFGSGAAQADQIFWDRRVIAASGNDPLDLAGTLLNPNGGTITFANVKGIAVYNRSDESISSLAGAHVATDADIVVLDTSSTFQGPCKTVAKGQEIQAGGIYIATNPLAAGWAVTAGSADIFQVDNQDGADEALYDIMLIGDAA